MNGFIQDKLLSDILTIPKYNKSEMLDIHGLRPVPATVGHYERRCEKFSLKICRRKGKKDSGLRHSDVTNDDSHCSDPNANVLREQVEGNVEERIGINDRLVSNYCDNNVNPEDINPSTSSSSYNELNKSSQEIDFGIEINSNLPSTSTVIEEKVVLTSEKSSSDDFTASSFPKYADMRYFFLDLETRKIYTREASKTLLEDFAFNTLPFSLVWRTYTNGELFIYSHFLLNFLQ